MIDICEWSRNPDNSEAIEILVKASLRFVASSANNMKDGEVTGWVRALTFLQSMVRGLRAQRSADQHDEEIGELIAENGFLRDFEIKKIAEMINGKEDKRDGRN